MASKWGVLSLREAGVSLLDCEHRTPPANGSGYPYIAIPQIKQGRLDLAEARRIAPEHYREWTRKAKPQPYDVILSRRCNPGATAFVPPGLECALGQNLVLLRADGTKVFPSFLRWLVRGPEWWEQIGNFINVGAVFDSLKCADIPSFRLTIPPMSEQMAIAAVLGTLDDKIELNRRMNETLEAMARAIFKSWFVDFDPVRAKSGTGILPVSGRRPIHGQDAHATFPLGLPPNVADLFPDSFEDSELGKIPKGWQCSRWGELATLEYGKSLRGYDSANGRYRVFGTNGPIGSHEEALCPNPGVVIGRKGAYRGIHFSPDPFFVIDTAFYLKPRGCLDIKWAYYELLRLDINSMDSGSAIPLTSRGDFYRILTCVPPPALQERFGEIVDSLFAKKYGNDRESRILAATRDAVLPKLLSGEIRVPDGERWRKSSARYS